MKKALHIWRYYGTRTQSWLYRMLRNTQRYTPWLLLHHHWPQPGENTEFPWPAEQVIFFPRHAAVLRFLAKLWPMLQTRTTNVLGMLDARYIAKLCNTANYKIIHIHFGWTACTFLGATRNLGAPTLVSFYGKDLFVRSQRYEARLRQLLRISRLHFHVTSRALEQAALELGAPAEGLSVVPVGIDLSIFPELGQVEQRLYARSTVFPVRILSVGRLIEVKAQDQLPAVAKILAERGIPFQWTIIGDGPLRPALEQRIRELNLEENFRLLGSLPFSRVLAELYESDILVLNAIVDREGDRESLGVNLMEAGAVGLPAVSCRLGGIPEVVHHGETGLLVPPGDLPAMADAIACLARDSGLRRQMGMAAARHVRANFDARKLSAAIEELYDRMTAAASRSPS